MPTAKPKNNQQMRTFKYIDAKSGNNTDPVIRDKSSFIAFKSSCLKEYFNQAWFLNDFKLLIVFNYFSC